MKTECKHEWVLKGIDGYPWLVCRKCGIATQYTAKEARHANTRNNTKVTSDTEPRAGGPRN